MFPDNFLPLPSHFIHEPKSLFSNFLFDDSGSTQWQKKLREQMSKAEKLTAKNLSFRLTGFRKKYLTKQSRPLPKATIDDKTPRLCSIRFLSSYLLFSIHLFCSSLLFLKAASFPPLVNKLLFYPSIVITHLLISYILFCSPSVLHTHCSFLLLIYQSFVLLTFCHPSQLFYRSF